MVIKLLFVRSLAVVVCLAAAASALAQAPLAALAPPETAVAITFGSGGNPFAELRSDLSELDWQGAGETVRSILATSDDELDELSELLSVGGGPGPFAEWLEDFCPELREPLLQLANDRWLPPMEGFVAFEVQGLVPAVTGVVRLESASPGALNGIRSALSECASLVTSSGSADLYHLGGGSPPIAAVTDDGLLVVANRPSLVEDVLDRNTGGATNSSLLASFERFEPADSYLGLAIRPPAFIDAVEVFLGTAESDQALLAKVTASLSTVESVSGQWSVGGSAVVSEWAVEVDPDGADQALANLLLCSSCRASTPFLVPDGAVAVSSSRLPLEEAFDYLQSWLDVSEEPEDLRALLQSELGIDIDRDLFDWLGDELHAAVLGAVGTDLTTLLYGPGQLFMIPVTSEADAEAGLARIADVLGNELSMVDSGVAPEFAVAVRQVEYRGFEYDRIQASANLDLGLGLVGNHLVIAYPANAIESVIDTFQGEPGIVSRSSYRDAIASTPRAAHAVSVQDQSVQIQGFADLLRLAAQPVAFGLQVAATNFEAATDEGLYELWPVSTGDAVPQTLLVRRPEVAVEGELNESAGDPYIEFELSDLYRLEGLEPGDEVTVVVQSDEFDTTVSLIDLQQQGVFAYNDDAPDTSRSEINFTVEEGLDLAVQVTSFSGSATGNYRLTVNVVEAAAPTETQAEISPPNFAEILTLTELPAEILEILADHIGTTVGYSVTDENVLYGRSETSLSR